MVPSSLTAKLASAADSEINAVLNTGATHLGQAKPKDEVGYVAAVVLGGVPKVASAWQSILKPAYSLSMTGVFCHKSPQASFLDPTGSRKRCELADLLIVVDDVTSGRIRKRVAALVQAKMAAAGGGKTLSAARDLAQLDLFSNWPSFTLPSPYKPASRNFSTCRHPGSTVNCGRYGLIERKTSPQWHQQAPNTTMPAGGDELGTFMANMVTAGVVGYGREATGSADDWSDTVDELLKVTSSLTFTYASGFKHSQNRQVSALAYMQLDRCANWFIASTWDGTPPTGFDRPPRDVDSGEGISTIHIEVSEGG